MHDYDLTCLAEGVVFPADFNATGLCQNEMIVGTTGCGKSVSICEPRMLHTNHSSLVIPLAKSKLKKKYAGMFKKRGYKVIDMDFVHPEKSTKGYDPYLFIRTNEDIINISQHFVHTGGYDKSTVSDPYWENSAVNLLGSLIALEALIAKENQRTPCFANVVEMFQNLILVPGTSKLVTSLDDTFEYYEDLYPNNLASSLWKIMSANSPKTATCVYSTLQAVMSRLFSENILKMMRKKEKISFKELGNEKTVLFITSSPMEECYSHFINLMYGDMFKELFHAAEASKKGHLKVPVHIVCDDFACTSKIDGFDRYISIFRAAGISVTLLLQSESQLVSMYSENAASTILNNCDTYVYMGGMDLTTCRNISTRYNKPMNYILEMPLENVLVFRRGSAPVMKRRYQTYQDPIYIRDIMGQNEMEIS